ncbi:hypothetical protein V8E54_008773 [Elaphomyces granulatus]
MTPALADKSPAKAAPRHLETSSSQHRMDIPNLEVVTLSGKRLSLKEDLQEAVRFLEEDGCLVLKGATDLSPVESILSTNKPSVDAVKKDIVLNDVVKAILFSARDDDFRITSYQAYKLGTKAGETGRDREWKEMAAHSGLVGVSCTHFGGDPTVSWVIEVDTGSRGEPTGKTVNVEANGHDMYVPSTDIYSYLLTAV